MGTLREPDRPQYVVDYISSFCQDGTMAWVVEYHEDYLAELNDESHAVQVAVYANAGLLRQFGPQLSRPYVDTLNGSAYQNMKELRITIPGGPVQCDDVWTT